MFKFGHRATGPEPDWPAQPELGRTQSKLQWRNDQDCPVFGKSGEPAGWKVRPALASFPKALNHGPMSRFASKPTVFDR
jgi:hypothetical protein